MVTGKRLLGLGGGEELDPGRLERALARLRRPLDRAYESWALSLPALRRLGASAARAAPPAGSTAPHVLVVSLRGWAAHSAYETTIAQALRLRGARVSLLTCGGGLPACELGWGRRAHPRPCDRCGRLSGRAARAARLERHSLRELLPWGGDARAAPGELGAEWADAESARAAARVSSAWLLKATQPGRVPGGEAVGEDMAVAAAGVHGAAEKLLRRLRPDVVFTLNGLFAAERMLREAALRHGARAPTYETAPRAGALVFSQDAPAPDYDTDALWEQAREQPLSPAARTSVFELLEDRAQGKGAHESYFDRVQDDRSELRRRLGLSGGEQVVSLFTNLTWDSATIGRDVGFGSMFDWVEQAVRLAASREIVLVVRVHPAEARWGTREDVRGVLESRLDSLPANVRFVGAQEPLSSYELMDLSRLVLTYATTVGLEAAARGRLVAVAGATHYRGRGFTIDLEGPAHLERVLEEPPPLPGADTVELALRYAHAFFMRAMIPFPLVQVRGGRVVRVPTATELQPGADRRLDWICARILDGGDFSLPDELLDAPAPVLAQARMPFMRASDGGARTASSSSSRPAS